MGKMIDHYWVGKRVLITGHTGFKDMWLAIFLSKLEQELLEFLTRLFNKLLYKAVNKSKIFEKEKIVM